MSRLKVIKEYIDEGDKPSWNDIVWLVEQAEKTEFWKQRFFEENKKVLDFIYEKTIK